MKHYLNTYLTVACSCSLGSSQHGGLWIEDSARPWSAHQAPDLVLAPLRSWGLSQSLGQLEQHLGNSALCLRTPEPGPPSGPTGDLVVWGELPVSANLAPTIALGVFLG